MKKATFQHEAQHLMLRLMLKSSFFFAKCLLSRDVNCKGEAE
jgi:hypothetical protein